MTKIKEDDRVYRKVIEEPKRARNDKGQLVAKMDRIPSHHIQFRRFVMILHKSLANL